MSQGAPCEKQVIGPKDMLLRRVPYLDPRYVKDDGTVSSFAFSLRKRNGVKEEGLSVDVEHMTTYARSILRAADFRLYSLVTEDVRGLKLSVCHDPCPKEDTENVAHALISGTIGKPSDCTDAANTFKDAPVTINERLAKCLARASRRVNYPDRT
ncbi:MAG: hypothetical protein RBT71_10025 [Flavobacteriales bacterium]|jgi:hypothetical protein|nr:hypothetical protein [Flavobacteriales bacterium]